MWVDESSVLSGLPLLTETVLLGTGGPDWPMISSSSLKAEFLLPLTISTGGIWAMLGLRSGTRGGVPIEESFVLTVLTSFTDFCLTGTGGGVPWVCTRRVVVTIALTKLLLTSCRDNCCGCGCRLALIGIGLRLALFSLLTTQLWTSMMKC